MTIIEDRSGPPVPSRRRRPSPSSGPGPGPPMTTTPTSTRTSRSSAASATWRPPCPSELGGWGLDLADFAAMQRTPGHVRAGHRAGHVDAPLLGRHRGRARALRRHVVPLDPRARPSPDEVFAAGHAEVGNDAPVVMSTTHRRASRRRLPLHRPQDVRLERAGVVATSACTASTCRTRTAPMIVHGFVDRDSRRRDRRAEVGHAGHAPVAELRHRCSKAPSSPTHSIGRVSSPPARNARPVPAGHEHLGAAADRQRLPRHRRTGARAGGRVGDDQVVGGDPSRHLRPQPDGAAPDRRDVPRARPGPSAGRPAHRRLAQRCRPRRDVGRADRVGQVASRRPRPSGSSTSRSTSRAAAAWCAATSSSGSTATFAAVASTPPTTR